MNAVLRFALRMTLATLAIGTVAAAFVAGYEVGYGQALKDYDFLPTIPVDKAK